MQRRDLAQIRRLVVKVGTGSITDGSGNFDAGNCARLARDLAAVAQNSGRPRKLVLVSSGAIPLGAKRLGLVRSKDRPWDIATKQAAAAVGQPLLIAEWERALSLHGYCTGQLLLTADDLGNRSRFLNARHTFERLLELPQVMPVVNENDPIAVDEIKVGDNDTLASHVALCIEAELLILLTDVDGLYDRNPREVGAQLIAEVPKVTPTIEKLAGGAGSERSVGGMLTKVKAAQRLAEQGVATAILSSRTEGALASFLSGGSLGTLFLPRPERSRARKAWLAASARGRGELVVDEGAERAVTLQGRSLLPSGIKEVRGSFGLGDPVDIRSLSGGTESLPFARGLAAYSAEEIRRVAGHKSSEIEQLLGYKYLDEVVHRNDLVLLNASQNLVSKPSQTNDSNSQSNNDG